MSSYLESLSLRLAGGLAQRSEECRARHAQWLRDRILSDGGFSGREGGSDLYYTGFALRSLAMLGALDEDIAQRVGGFLRKRLAGQTAIIDFLSLIYGGMLLRWAGVDIFAEAPPGWPQAVQRTLEALRRPDGGYAKTDEGQSSSTYHSFLVVLCYQVIDVPLVEPEKLIAFVRGRQRDDGGFVEVGPMKRSGANPTAAAVGLLRILEAVDDGLRADVVEYLAEMQSDEGGFKANTQIPAADVLSTFTATLTLSDLGALDAVDTRGIERFVSSLEQPSGGFLAGEWDSVADVEYTFYGLGAWALLSGA